MESRIELVPTKVFSERWSSSYFPDDMPPEWRLDYYFNEFRSVYFSQQQFDALDEESLESLFEALGAGVQIIADAGWDDSRFTASHRLCRLSDVAAPWVTAKATDGAWLCGNQRIEQLLLSEQTSPRDMRSLAEQFVQRCSSDEGVWLVDSGFAKFDELRTLLELMGLY